MAKQITMTIPDRLYEAISVAGAEMEMSPSERVKAWLQQGAEAKEGVVVKLQLAPLAPSKLPLLDMMEGGEVP